jgi:aryl-phospho-beta-D-glucosidase BglC (GH1 family)
MCRFGFETSSTAVDGLWEGPTALTQNFDTIAWRIKLLGFNAIRLPFSFQVLPWLYESNKCAHPLPPAA